MTIKRLKFLILSGVLLIGVPFLVHITTYGWQWDWVQLNELDVSQKQSERYLRASVDFLAEDIGVRDFQHHGALLQSAEYIYAQFEDLGYTVRRQEYLIDNKRYYNIVAEYKFIPKDVPSLIVGAHYDSYHSPGADDNASGVAVLLELARLLKDHTFIQRVKYIAFVNEELPHFQTRNMGSHVYARTAHQSGEDIRAVLVLESMGYYNQQGFSQRYLAFMGPFYPNQANFLAVVGNFDSASLVNTVHRALHRPRFIPVEKLVAPEFTPGVYFSDHWSFWQYDYPAVMLTDTAFLRNPHYHSEADLADTLDYAMMARGVWALRSAMLEMDQNQP